MFVTGKLHGSVRQASGFKARPLGEMEMGSLVAFCDGKKFEVDTYM
jgi:hypothetical protein